MMASENGRWLLTRLLENYVDDVGETTAVTEARSILDADVTKVRENIAARLDRAADHNEGGFKRVLTMLAKRVRDGKENADL